MPADLTFHCRRYVNLRILSEVNADKHWKKTVNIKNVVLN